jgi:hypothetical protein
MYEKLLISKLFRQELIDDDGGRRGVLVQVSEYVPEGGIRRTGDNDPPAIAARDCTRSQPRDQTCLHQWSLG